MYLKTPKRYRQQTRRSIIPTRRLFGWALMGLLIGAGLLLLRDLERWQNELDRLSGQVIRDLERRNAVLSATPTPTPDFGLLDEAESFWQAGAVAEAVPRYARMLDALPNDETAHYRVTFGSLALGDSRAALRYAERYVTANPYSAEAWALRSWALSDEGDPGAALSSALNARALNPASALALAREAEAFFSAEQPQRAEATANEAIEADPESYLGYWVRGRVREEGLFDFTAAEADYQEALALAQTSEPIAVGLISVDIAQLQVRNQAYDDAVATLNEVLKTNPENTLALYWMGLVQFTYRGDPGQANTFLLRCVDYNPESYNCHYLLGRTQFSLEQLSSAADSFAAAVRNGTPFARHYWWTANAYFALNNCARALEFLEPGYEIARNDGNTPQDLLDAYDYLGNQCGASFTRALPPATATPTATPSAEGAT